MERAARDGTREHPAPTLEPHRGHDHDDHGPEDHGHDDHGHGHRGHSHAVSRDADQRYLVVALLLLLAFMVAEVATAFAVRSVALLADAGHMLTDAGALGVSIAALRLAARPAAGRMTFGWKRAEILSAAANGITLVIVGVLVAVEAVRRLIHPVGVGGLAVLVVALIGLGVNIAASLVLRRADRGNLNIEGAFQHVLTDAYGFAGTAAAGAVILATGWARADSVASLVIAAIMLRAAWSLLRDSGRVLLEVAPEGVDLAEVREHLLAADCVDDVHDLHVWNVGSDLPSLSAHVVIADSCFTSGHAPALLDRLQSCLVGDFDVEHSTFQLESVGHADHEPGTHH